MDTVLLDYIDECSSSSAMGGRVKRGNHRGELSGRTQREENAKQEGQTDRQISRGAGKKVKN